MISYAQNFEDVMLWRALKHVSDGRYADVGAFHPEIDSVTKWFYDQGWCGINLEPVPESFAMLQAERPRDTNLRAAAGADEQVAEMTVFAESRGLSSLRPSTSQIENLGEIEVIQVQVLPLRDILQPLSGHDIHFLKIDAEGTEREVLLGMDFGRFRPWIILVEATVPLSATRSTDDWSGILLQHNYKHVYFDGLNDFFVSGERSELAKHFKTPPNVFDDFELASLARERNLVAALNAHLSAAHQQIANLQQQAATFLGQRDQLSNQLAASQAVVAKLSGDVSELSESLKTARTQLDSVFRSRSWRWLGPIRRANFLLKSYRRKLRGTQLLRPGRRTPQT